MGIDQQTSLIIILAVAVANISVGLMVLLSGIGNAQRRWFVSLVGWSTIWVLTNVFYPYVGTGNGFWLALVSYASAAATMMSIAGLCFEITKVKANDIIKKLYYASGMLIAIGSAIPGVLALDINDDLSIKTRLAAQLIYISFIIMSFLLTVAVMAASYLTATGLEKAKIRLMLVGLSLAVLVGAAFNLILPLFGNYDYIQLGPSGMIFFVIASALAMVRYKMLNVRSVAVRTVAYVLSITALASIYFSLAYIASLVIFNDTIAQSVNVGPMNVVLALALALVFQPVHGFFNRMTDHIFYRSGYDTGDFLLRIGRILTSTTELHDVLEKAGTEIRETLKAEGSMFLVYRDHHPNELVGEGTKKHFSADELSVLQNISESSRGTLLVIDKLKASGSSTHQQLYEILTHKEIALALPLMSADEMIGYFMLGEHKAGGYSRQDIEALEAIANELVIAIQNARSVQVVRDLNAHLEQRVASATKELRSSNEQLRRLDAAKDEFVSMASHQLRTPLTSVKGYISMVLEGDAGKINPMQRKLLEEAFMSSERMVHLISDFLNVSRLQTGKFVIEKTLVNLAELVEQEVDSLTPTAEAHELKLKFRKPSHFPSLYIDEGKLHQVVMNFIDNAIYYSKEHTAITVKLAVEDGDVVLEVIDTGIGVPKSEQAGLFTKFFRAANARRQRPDGTGIGLFLAKMVITAHGGSMVFESVEGEGSKFGFRLPIKKLSESPSENVQPLEKPSDSRY